MVEQKPDQEQETTAPAATKQADQQPEDDEFFEQEYFTDPNGVPVPRTSLSEHKYSQEQLREMKQKYLMENVINTGYDATEFAQFMEYKKGKTLFQIFLTESDCVALLQRVEPMWITGSLKIS